MEEAEVLQPARFLKLEQQIYFREGSHCSSE